MTSKTSTPERISGTWRNDNASEMQLEVDAAGAISGTYRTGVGRPEASQIFPLSGFANGDLVAFCVNFAGFGSLTSWTGKLVEDGTESPVIHTLWHLARDKSGGEPTALWESILAGATQFRRVG